MVRVSRCSSVAHYDELCEEKRPQEVLSVRTLRFEACFFIFGVNG